MLFFFVYQFTNHRLQALTLGLSRNVLQSLKHIKTPNNRQPFLLQTSSKNAVKTRNVYIILNFVYTNNGLSVGYF